LAKKSARPMSWMELAVRNAGMRRGITALSWALCWALVRESLGRDPSVEEVADWWRESHRTAYREQAAFRQAFPTLDTPARILESNDARAKLQSAAANFDKADEKRNQRRSVPEIEVLQLGLMSATL